jgi:hypothetical protein
MTTALPPTGLQADLLVVVQRLNQIELAGGFDQASPVVVERVLTCDLPRLRAHLTPETLLWAATP